MTKRQEQVSSLIQREVSQYLLEERPEEITGVLTIKSVEVSPDLEHAKVFFSIVGQDETRVMEILKQNIYDLQGQLIRKLQMKKIPRIAFVADHSGEYAQRIGSLIRKMHKSH